MSRPKNKLELLELSDKNYNKMIDLVESFSATDQEKEFPTDTLNRNIGDVLAHLHHWHLMFLEWYAVGMAGEKPDMPAEGYTWKKLPELNREIWKKYRKTPLKKSKCWLAESHAKVYNLIKRHTEEELFEKRRYAWTGTTSLGAYLISSTSSHYDWAYKLIKRCKKKEK
ncbi:MAG: ClbS/DfsB family four-helix bundle protein [Bacteroidota bacterium]